MKAKSSVNWDALKKRLFDRVHTDGEKMKNDLPNVLEIIIEHEGWKHFASPEGKPFSNLGDFLTTAFPSGIGCGQSDTALSYEEVMTICEGRKKVYAALCKHHKRNGRGRKAKDATSSANASRDAFNSGHGEAKTRKTLAVRLAQEFPKHFAAYQRGQYSSIRAAAEAAGLVPPGHDPLMRMKAYWRKATEDQRAEFRKWIKTKSAK